MNLKNDYSYCSLNDNDHLEIDFLILQQFFELPLLWNRCNQFEYFVWNFIILFILFYYLNKDLKISLSNNNYLNLNWSPSSSWSRGWISKTPLNGKLLGEKLWKKWVLFVKGNLRMTTICKFYSKYFHSWMKNSKSNTGCVFVDPKLWVKRGYK